MDVGRERFNGECRIMTDESQKSAAETLDGLDDIRSDLESLYKDVHAHPELSMQETRTAEIAADWLRDAGFDVTTEVGETGVVGAFHNGDGLEVMLYADTDTLPKPRRRTRRNRRKSRHSTAWKTTPAQPKPSSTPFARSSMTIRSER